MKFFLMIGFVLPSYLLLVRFTLLFNSIKVMVVC